MDHRPSPTEVTRIEQQANKQAKNELEASHEVEEFMNQTTPQRKDYFSEQDQRTKH